VIKLTHKQEEALKGDHRKAVFDYLNERGRKRPAALGEISRGIDLRDLAKVHYHLDVLVDVELVEKVRGTNRYRLVEGE
jgi:DNA-binding IclR family transcriptional regulator